MTREKIQPFGRSGGWTTPHYFYFPIAQSFLQQSKDLSSSTKKRVAELKQKTKIEEPKWDDETITSYIDHLIRDDAWQLEALCIATQFFSCMAVEAFLNFYGVNRLGEKYYKHNLERLGISEKLKILITICTQEIIEDQDEIVQLVRRMFDRRNSLAHPKAKELTSISNSIPLADIDHLSQAEQAVNEMTIFFDKFQELVGNLGITNPNFKPD